MRLPSRTDRTDRTDAPPLSTLPGRLRYARTLRGMGSRELGAAAGLSHATVAAIEGRSDAGDGVSVGAVRELARALDVRPEWLAWGIGRPPRAEPAASQESTEGDGD